MNKRYYDYSIYNNTMVIYHNGYSIADISDVSDTQASDKEYCKKLVEDTLYNMGYISKDELIEVATIN
jgi:hypothetical protein